MRQTSIILSILAAVLLAGCIKNDIPYPRIQPNFTSLEARGQDQGTIIDTVARTATIHFPEEVDITAVEITGYTLSPGASIVDNPLGSPIDLSNPFTVILRLYQDYLWKITGVQEIERYFEVTSQIGTTTIDVPARRILVHVAASQKLDAIHVERPNSAPRARQ